MILGYGTNGFANHRLGDALEIIADLGYRGVALTLDHHHLDPYAPDLAARVRTVRRQLDHLDLHVVIETGARYLLDPLRKHEPTLVSAVGQDRRIDFLRRALAIACDLGASVVSLWSGVAADDDDPAEVWRRLVGGCAAVLDDAEAAGVTLGFEPEPGMVVDTVSAWQRLASQLGHPRFGLTLDIGHCRCVEDDDAVACVRASTGKLAHVQIDDMRRGVHEHLEFGDGEIDFPPVLRALEEIGYRGLVAVELPRHSHAAPIVAGRSLRFLHSAANSELESR